MINSLRFSVFSLLVVAAGSANALTFQVRDAVGGEDTLGAVPGYYLVGTGSRPKGTYPGAIGVTLHTGTLDLENRQVPSPVWLSFHTYCIEPSQGFGFTLNPPGVSGVGYTWTSLASSGYSVANEAILEKLWANALADSKTSQVKAAAFQALVWELRFDAVPNITAGGFFLNSSDVYTQSVIAQANTYLTNITTNVWTSKTDLYTLTNQFSQDLLTPVPEPATLVAMGVGAAALLRRRRKA